MRLVSCFPAELISFCGSAGKESACNVRDLDSIPGLGRSPGEGKGCPFQYCGLENSMDCIVHGVTESDTTEATFTFHVKGLYIVEITSGYCCLVLLCFFATLKY